MTEADEFFGGMTEVQVPETSGEPTALPGEPEVSSPSARDIMQLYFDHRSGLNEAWHAVQPRVYHASEAGYCVRNLWYKHMGVPEEREKPLGLFRMGELAEGELEAALKLVHGEEAVRKRRVVFPMGPFVMDPVVTGESDPIVHGADGMPLIQYECKSNARGRRSVTSYTQKCQAAVYAKILSIPDNRVVHPSRNSLHDDMPDKDTIITLAEVEKLWEQALNRFWQLDRALGEEKLPMASPPSNSQCNYCDFAGRCQNDGGWKEGPKGGKKRPDSIYGTSEEDD